MEKLASRRAIPQRPDDRDKGQLLGLADFTAGFSTTNFPTPFGSSIVRTGDGELLTRQVNHSRQNLDPTAHAEVYAIRAACKKLKSISLKGYTLYSTCEPCPMCMAASLWAEIDRVVYGATIKDAAGCFRQIYISSKQLAAKSDMKCEVVGPVERNRCVELFRVIDSRVREDRQSPSAGRSK